MKKALRKESLEKRDLLQKEDIIGKSKAIKEKLFLLSEFINAKTIAFYVSKGSEVFTHNIIKELLGEKRILVPKVLDNEIVFSEIDNFNELKPGKFDILEPVEIKEANHNEIDLIIVPGIAFDKKGHRIGYGYGYYDKILKKINCKKIGLVFSLQIVDKIPKEDYDVAVDKVITEEMVIDCG